MREVSKPEGNLLYGEVLGIKCLISYEGETGKLLKADFKEAIDAYFWQIVNHMDNTRKIFQRKFQYTNITFITSKGGIFGNEEQNILK